ncbi:MAG: hypothetical protein Q7S60_01775 [bacterium]|nr:hypothetical protein [bacterium]
MSRKMLLFLPLLVAFLLFPQEVQAKKQLPQASSQKSSGTRVSSGKGVGVSVKFANYKRAISATFTNLGIASSVTYQLTYTQNGINEGAGGSISDLSSGTTTRQLLFGTCSKGVCRYHTGIKNAKFVVTTTLKDGRKTIKTFKLKV